jgi:hypothetical protein
MKRSRIFSKGALAKVKEYEECPGRVPLVILRPLILAWDVTWRWGLTAILCVSLFMLFTGRLGDGPFCQTKDGLDTGCVEHFQEMKRDYP